MKNIFLLILLFVKMPSFSQTVFNVYKFNEAFGDPIISNSDLNNSEANSNFPLIDNSSIRSGFSGEYEIEIGNYYKPFNFIYPRTISPNNQYSIKYDMEVVSFPFVPQCSYQTIGCASEIGREFHMPLDNFNLTNQTWGDYSNKFIQPRDLDNSNDQSLSSTAFLFNQPLVNLNSSDRLLLEIPVKLTP